MKISDIVAHRLSASIVTPLLAERIRGRSDVEPLRRLIRGTHMVEDFDAIEEWTRTELRAVCHENWGPPTPSEYEGYDQIRGKVVKLPPITAIRGSWESPVPDGIITWSKKTPHLQLANDIIQLRVAVNNARPKPKPEEIFQPEPSPKAIPCPKDLAYMPFQLDGIRWTLPKQHALIADEPGLGKTIQALGAINVLDPQRIVVVCPASVKINWQREAEAWMVKPRSIGIAIANTLPSDEFIIINYDIVDRHAKELVARGIDFLVLDEVHFIKSRDSKRTIACTQLIRAAKRGVYLSGTPMLNRPIELLPLLTAVQSPIAVDYPRRYCGAKMKDAYVKGGQKRRVYDESGATNLDELKKKLSETFMIRRLKADVLADLPAKRRRTLALPDVEGADDIARRASELMREVDIEAIVSGEKPAPLDTGALALLRHEEALAKVKQALDYASEILEDGEGKIVIFAHHRDVVEAMASGLLDYKPVILYGGMTPTEKQQSIDSFQNDPSVRVFVGSIQAAGVGITLTAASRVLFVEMDWVPANMTQAEDRCHRKGQKDTVLIEHLVVPGGVDERICRALVRKQEVLSRAI